MCFFFFKQKTAYEMRISDWSSDVCSSDLIGDRLQGKSIGFGAHVAGPDERRAGEVLKQIEPEDLLKFGLIPEFVGRLPVIATLEDLDVDALGKIPGEPKNALVKQYKKLFAHEIGKASFREREWQDDLKT